jgi:hypothetical protein
LDPDQHGTALILVGWTRSGDPRLGKPIRVQEGQKSPTKIEKCEEISSFEVPFWGAEGFSCSMNVLYGGLGLSKFQFLIKKILVCFQM